MRPEELVKILNRDVINGNLELYKNLLDTTNEATDPVWRISCQYTLIFQEKKKKYF